MKDGGSGLILAVQLARVQNAGRAAWSSNPAETTLLGIGATVLLAYEAADTYREVAHCAVCRTAVHANAANCLIATLMATGGIGVAMGSWSVGRLRSLARASWLAPLPWSDDARRRAVRHAMRVYGGALAGFAACLIWVACHALRLPASDAWTVATFGVFAAGFNAGARSVRSPSGGNAALDEVLPVPPGRWPGFDALDRIPPRHAGRWAWAGRTRLIAGAALLSFVPLGGAAAAVSLTRHESVPAMAMAVLGGNFVFVLALRCRPMASAVFRTAPLGFTRAAAAMVRAPLALSAAVFATIVVVPLGADPALVPMVAGVAGGLLVMNGVYVAAALYRPDSPRQALLLYAGGLYAVIYETATAGMAYGTLTMAAVALMAALLIRRARFAYRCGHG